MYPTRLLATHAVVVTRPFPGMPNGATHTKLCSSEQGATSELNRAIHTSPPPTTARILDLLAG